MGESNELIVEGMTCSNCAQGLSKKLSGLGLEQVQVNFSTGEVAFNNARNISKEAIKGAIESLGYALVSSSDQGKNQTLSKIERKFYLSLPFSILLFSHMFLPFEWLHQPLVQLALCLPVMGIGLQHFGKSAWSSLRNGFPNMDVLIFIGSTAAFAYSLIGTILFYDSPSIGNYLFYETATTIISLVLLGNVIEHRSVRQTTTAIAALNQLRESKANRIVEANGEEKLEEVALAEVRIGDVLQINEGDKIPIDGKIISGKASVDESMITGESEAIKKEINAPLIGGSILRSGNFRMVVTAVGKDTVLSKIIELVKRAQAEKPGIQKLGDKVSAIFVPVVVLIALITFLIWYLIMDASIRIALMNAIAVLVISCPCAMGLATPTAVMVGIGRAAKKGILIKGGATVELFAEIKQIVFDKTGTLSSGNFSIDRIQQYDSSMETDQIKSILLSMEQYSSHPIARSIYQQLKEEAVKSMLLKEQEEIKGKGIRAKDLEGNTYQLGSANWLLKDKTDPEHSIFLFKNDQLIAGITLSDEIRPGTKSMIEQLKRLGIKTFLLSGDRKEKTAAMATQLGIDGYKAEQLPEEKLQLIEQLQAHGPLAMVGDGINDAPALAKADVGISLSNSTQIAIQSAQIVLLKTSNFNTLIDALLLSKHTLITIKQNLFWAFFYNVLAIPFAALGFLNPMIAALSMAFSDVIVVGNSLRLKRKQLN